MKAIVSSILLLAASLPMHAAEKAPMDKFTVRALERLDKKLGTTFDIPFPKEQLDIDVHLTQPIGILDVNGKKVRITRPVLNPYDGSHTVEWNVGPDNPARFVEELVYCHLSLDKDSNVVQISILAPDSWTTEKGGSNSVPEVEGEPPAAYFPRAMASFRIRAKKAKDPAQAELALSAIVKVVTSLQSQRNEELTRKP